MKTAKKKKWAYRFLLSPVDRDALAFLVARRQQAVGDGLKIQATMTARQAISLVARKCAGVAGEPRETVKTHFKTAMPWSLVLGDADKAALVKIKKAWGLRFRNETLCFALRTQAAAEGWKP